LIVAREVREATATSKWELEAMGSSTAISPASGPVVVTGASGFIGSWTVLDLLEQGYHVRACVRDVSRVNKVAHLTALGQLGLRGIVELAEGDLGRPGSYDDAFHGCVAVFHIGAAVGYNRETPRQVFDGCFTDVQHVLNSARKAGTIRRFVFTSSFAAVIHPRPAGYVFTEKDWCDDNRESDVKWNTGSIDTIRDVAYAMAKAKTEKMLYAAAARDGSFDAAAILPVHVIGPLITSNHDQGKSWQQGIKRMLEGHETVIPRPGNRMLWNIVDVRDVARAHRLAAERSTVINGSRYILAASDRSGELFTWQLQEKLAELFPGVRGISGEAMQDGRPAASTYDSPRAYSLLARQELGLQTHSVDETIRATADSYFRLGLLPGSEFRNDQIAESEGPAPAVS
jgi:nucleoside-diphosphate-sugar epimerase